MLFLPLDKRNTRDKATGLCISSERYIGELGVRTYIGREPPSREGGVGDYGHAADYSHLYATKSR